MHNSGKIAKQVFWKIMDILIPPIPNEWLVSTMFCSTSSMGLIEGKEPNICSRCIVVPFIQT